ncbi:MAG: aspartate aminotransferase family protein [Gammaproteobacteria bacterium]|jgi:4-aminobutyrate--pyruvate transaminase|nr:aspartate aminotransferase family protein [Gammaproteobacteria bacterium]MDX2460609.1 aspartate aminotransferase family protein [Gammaproteobacteria bacterium]
MTHAPNSLAARDVAYAMHPYTNLAQHEERGPTVFTRGEGIYIWDDEGNKYLEGLAGLWCTSLGYSEQRLVDAAVKQLGTLPFAHTFAHRSSIPVIELCEALIKMAPGDMGKVFLVNSGSEAVDAAIKMIWYYNNALDRPEKKKIISRKRGYHGVTIAGGSLTAIPLMQNDFDLPLERFLHTDTPCYYRYGQDGESEEAFATRLADSLNDLIEAEGPDTVAAFVAEPVMGAGGVLTPPATYFEKVQKVLDRHDVLMVADEVICGFGRTGNMWGSQTYRIKPDIVTCAKQLSSAYLPIAAVMISDPIYQAFVEQSRKLGAYGSGHTYGGHPVSAAVALETLKIYEERDIVGHVREVTPRFQTRLHALADHPLVGEARGIGLIGAVEIVSDKNSREQFSADVKAGAIIAEKIFEQGLIVRGLPGDAVATCPPLIINDNQIDELFDKFEAGLNDAAKALKV